MKFAREILGCTIDLCTDRVDRPNRLAPRRRHLVTEYMFGPCTRDRADKALRVVSQ
jgi:hypothetical protein